MLYRLRLALLLIVLTVLGYLVNDSYLMVLLRNTALMVASIFVIISAVKTIKMLLAERKTFTKPAFYTLVSVLVACCAVLTTTTAISMTNYIKPINLYTASEDGDIEEGVLYVTHHEDCVYCQASHDNMLRAVSAFNSSHITPVRVVNLKNDTKLAKSLDEKLDHYGSIVKYKDGVQYEVTYTISDTEGTPLENSPTNIYNGMKEVINK